MAIADTLSQAWEWMSSTPEGIFTAGAIPLGIAAYQTMRSPGRLPSMAAPQPALSYSEARQRASAALGPVYNEQIGHRLQQQATEYASRGLAGQVPAQALMTDALARLENARAAEEAALAQGMVARDLQRFLAQQALYWDYMLKKRQLEEQRRNNLVNSLLNIARTGLGLYNLAGQITGRWPFSGGRWTPEAASNILRAAQRYTDVMASP